MARSIQYLLILRRLWDECVRGDLDAMFELFYSPAFWPGDARHPEAIWPATRPIFGRQTWTVLLV